MLIACIYFIHCDLYIYLVWWFLIDVDNISILSAVPND